MARLRRPYHYYKWLTYTLAGLHFLAFAIFLVRRFVVLWYKARDML